MIQKLSSSDASEETLHGEVWVVKKNFSLYANTLKCYLIIPVSFVTIDVKLSNTAMLQYGQHCRFFQHVPHSIRVNCVKEPNGKTSRAEKKIYNTMLSWFNFKSNSSLMRTTVQSHECTDYLSVTACAGDEAVVHAQSEMNLGVWSIGCWNSKTSPPTANSTLVALLYTHTHMHTHSRTHRKCPTTKTELSTTPLSTGRMWLSWFQVENV